MRFNLYPLRVIVSTKGVSTQKTLYFGTLYSILQVKVTTKCTSYASQPHNLKTTVFSFLFLYMFPYSVMSDRSVLYTRTDTHKHILYTWKRVNLRVFLFFRDSRKINDFIQTRLTVVKTINPDTECMFLLCKTFRCFGKDLRVYEILQVNNYVIIYFCSSDSIIFSWEER